MAKQLSIFNKALSAALALALGSAPAIAGDAPAAARDAPAETARPELALMGTIPIYWGEADGLGEQLLGAGQPHWARALLERRYRLRPLAYLSAEALAGQSRLLLAQPRALSAEENVALDGWVRGGGRLLLFADPMMTGESRYALGDRRRPQDVALLSPILSHWGLAMRFDPEQRDGAQLGEIRGASVPIRVAGELEALDGSANCVVFAQGLAAQCGLGSGFALVVADAALLDLIDPAAEAPAALAALTGQAFGENGGPAAAAPTRAGGHAEKR